MLYDFAEKRQESFIDTENYGPQKGNTGHQAGPEVATKPRLCAIA
jgi:hypothetical protein